MNIMRSPLRRHHCDSNYAEHALACRRKQTLASEVSAHSTCQSHTLDAQQCQSTSQQSYNSGGNNTADLLSATECIGVPCSFIVGIVASDVHSFHSHETCLMLMYRSTAQYYRGCIQR